MYSSVSAALFLGQPGCHHWARLPSDPQAHLSAPPHATNHTLQAASVWRGPLSPSFFLLTAAVMGEGGSEGADITHLGWVFPDSVPCPSFFSPAKWALLGGSHPGKRTLGSTLLSNRPISCPPSARPLSPWSFPTTAPLFYWSCV